MEIKFWGVRGSVPTPSSHTSFYGGNTSCLQVTTSNKKQIILDAGTGIRNLGKTVIKSTDEVLILLTHLHWDHIQGLPFFAPVYSKSHKIKFFHESTVLEKVIKEMFDGIRFPIKFEWLLSKIEFVTVNPIKELNKLGFQIEVIKTNHPGGSFGYKFIEQDKTFIYLTDNELFPISSHDITPYDTFVSFCKNADLVVHDAQYIEEDRAIKTGWGHSFVKDVREFALKANIKHLVLFHHEPDRFDKQLDVILNDTNQWFKDNGSRTKCSIAKEESLIKI